MKAEELISILYNICENDAERFETLRKNVPLGVDEIGGVTVAFDRARRGFPKHLCVTGLCRGDFIRRVIALLSNLYPYRKLNVLVGSPFNEYTGLLSLNGADVTIPYVRNKGDVDALLTALKGLIQMREADARKYPRLLVVLDGLEEIEENDKMLDIYKPFLDAVRNTSVDIITGVDLLKSAFSGFPGAYVGIGNCLVSAAGEGKTDVTYVGEDSSLTAPVTLDYPAGGTLKDFIEYINATPKTCIE